MGGLHGAPGGTVTVGLPGVSPAAKPQRRPSRWTAGPAAERQPL